MAKRSPEPILWILFSAGGVVSAFLIPVLLFLFGVAFPLGWITTPDHARVLALFAHPLGRLLIFVLCSLSLFHWAHRFRYVVLDLGLKGGRATVAFLCYATAIVGTVLVILIALRVV